MGLFFVTAPATAPAAAAPATAPPVAGGSIMVQVDVHRTQGEGKHSRCSHVAGVCPTSACAAIT